MQLAIAYDVSEDANRRRVYRPLQRYGAWRQYSVFEVNVTKTERVEFEDELESIIDPSDGDRIWVYRLCRHARTIQQISVLTRLTNSPTLSEGRFMDL